MRIPLLLAAAAAALPLLAAEPSAPPTKVDGFTYVRTVGRISEYTLDANKLTVLLHPEHSAPVLTLMVTYRVGSANEVTGTTGATHLLEHLMFKGTPKFNKEKGTGFDQMLDGIGASNNATTWYDRTNYFENMGSEHLALAIELEADRMRNLRLLESDRQPEMTVVRNEFERGENSPFEALIKEIGAAAYIAHPYHHPTIGWRSDIEKVTIEKLREFYDTFYWPDNATVSVIGDFKPEQALALIRQHFGAIPKSPKPIPQVYTEEPEQQGARRVMVKRAGELGVVGLGHKTPAATHADFAPAMVLSVILTDGKNSRMFKALTDKNLTTAVEAFLPLTKDPCLHITFAALAPGAGHEQVEKIMLAEIEKVRTEGVTDDEVKTAVAKRLADSAYQRDGTFAIASNLNEYIAIGDWTAFYGMDEKLKQVTAADVKRVAAKYLGADQSTTGWFVPLSAEAPAKPGARKPSRADMEPRPSYRRDPRTSDAAPAAGGGSGAANDSAIAPRIVRAKSAGIDVLAYPTGVKDVVTLRAALPGGSALRGEGNAAVPRLTAMLLDQGTVKQSKFAIAAQLEGVGATMEFSVTPQLVEVKAKCLRKDVPKVVALMAEQLRTPAFSAEEFEKAKKQLAGTIRRALEDPQFRARDAFASAIFPAGHPNRDTTASELIAAVGTAKLQEVKDFHAKHYGPAGLTIVAVGDADAKQLEAEVGRAFAGWKGGVPVKFEAKPAAVGPAREIDVNMADKTSVSVLLGVASTLRHNDPDAVALRLATAVLGSGFTSRLVGNVRDTEGLTYSISAALGKDTVTDGEWRIQASFAPTLLQKGLDSTKRHLNDWIQKGITPDELKQRKSNLIGLYKVDLATTEGMAETILATVLRGNPLSWLDDYPKQINALTLEQVNGAIRKYVKPENLVLIKAGTMPAAPKTP
ncbi:MAG: insulinase family protein [Verrucomicrobia bacterium]|nr:insulinase family protein [Verrucomicrobiota bacterium]